MILSKFIRNERKISNIILQKIRNIYYRLLIRNVGKNLTVYGKVIIKGAENIKIGNNFRINDYSFLHGAGGIEIADNVTISAFSKVLSIGYETENWTSIYDKKLHKLNSIYIGEGAWICSGATILSGVKINGKGVILAANSVLNSDINEDYVLVAGNPAKIVKRYN